MKQRKLWLACLAAASLTSSPGTSGVAFGQDYSAAVAERVAAADVRLSEAFASGPVDGRFLERWPGAYVFGPKDRSLPIAPIGNPEEVGALAVGPEVAVAGEFDRETRTLDVESYELVGVPALQTNNPAATVAGAFEAAASITARLEEAAQPGAMNVQTRVLNRSNPLARDTLDDMATIGANYRAALEGGDRAAADNIANQWRTARETVADVFNGVAAVGGVEYKALYGTFDNYPPWRYYRIFEDAAAVVAIGRPGNNSSICSGVLVAEDLVLTAGHCFAGPPPTEPGDLEVWFGYAESPEGEGRGPIRRRIVTETVAPAQAKWPALMQHQFGPALYDYAIVRFAAPAGEPAVPEVEIVTGRKVQPRPQCLRYGQPNRADPLYVIGYPEGQRAVVHDNGRVELPFRIQEGPMFDLLRLEVHTDFLGAPDLEEVLKQFDDSYATVIPTASGIRWRHYFDVRDGGEPRMGIVADTFRGNSGGPVFDHKGNQCVVGLLIRGMQDTGTRLEADWKVHERVLPMRAILDDLRSNAETATVEASLRIE